MGEQWQVSWQEHAMCKGIVGNWKPNFFFDMAINISNREVKKNFTQKWFDFESKKVLKKKKKWKFDGKWQIQIQIQSHQHQKSSQIYASYKRLWCLKLSPINNQTKRPRVPTQLDYGSRTPQHLSSSKLSKKWES